MFRDWFPSEAAYRFQGTKCSTKWPFSHQFSQREYIIIETGKKTPSVVERCNNFEVFINLHPSWQKVGLDIWPLGGLYGKCKKFLLQWYYLTKVRHFSRSTQRPSIHLSIEIKSKNKKLRQKKKVNNMSCDLFIGRRLGLLMSEWELQDKEDSLSTNCHWTRTFLVVRQAQWEV